MEHNTRHSSRLARWSLIAGIVIVMNLFFNYALSLAYKSPDYNSYFPQSQVREEITTQGDCIAVGGQWNGSAFAPAPADKTVAQKGYCDPDFTKRQAYEAAQKQYDRTVFIALVILGVISVAAGSFLANEVLSLAFSWGGVLSLLIASIRYWSDANNLVKVVILAIALGSLIWTAVKKFA